MRTAGQQGRVRRASRPDASGSKLIRSFVCVALANRSSVRVDGRTRPLSRRATTACVVPTAAYLLLRHVGVTARPDHGGGQGELILQRIIGCPEFRILRPLLRGFRNLDISAGHLTPFARGGPTM
jgi:hypothetical protein